MASTRRYCPGITTQLAYWMARSGLTDEQIAEELGVKRATFASWRKRYPELRDAMKPGKEFVDFLVQGSLLKRALGQKVREVTRERVPVEWEKIGQSAVPCRWAMKITKRVVKELPGEVGAQAFWLKNRQGWRDAYDVKHGGTIEHKQDLSALTDEELVTMRSLAAKAEALRAGSN